MDNPKKVKEEKDTTSNNTNYPGHRSSSSLGIIDLTTYDDERQPPAFRTDLGTPITTMTSRQNDETDMKAIAPISFSSSNIGVQELKDWQSLPSDATQQSIETMSIRGNDSHDNNDMTTNEESDHSDDSRDGKAIISRLMSKPPNGNTQFSRHDGAKKFVDPTGSFKKGNFGFSHFESYKVALECLNAVIGTKEKTHFAIASSSRDSSGILSKVAKCTKTTERLRASGGSRSSSYNPMTGSSFLVPKCTRALVKSTAAVVEVPRVDVALNERRLTTIEFRLNQK